MYRSKQPKRPRSKVPVYPRPIEAIDVDDIPVCEDTVVYEHWTDDAEREAEERAKKRRKRRRDVAESYLRGGEVTILTASLRGPFEGWKNPWATKRKRIPGDAGLEVPETTLRPIRPSKMSSAPDQRIKGSERAPITIDDDNMNAIDANPCEIEPVNPFNAKTRPGNVTLGEQEPSSTKRVEDWLRTNDVYARRPRSPTRSSPTPMTKRADRHKTPSRSQDRDLNPSELYKQPAPELPRAVPTSRPGTASSAPTHESPRRAEAAILETKRRSLHTVPPSTNLPAIEYRRGQRDEKRPLGPQHTNTHSLSDELQNVRKANEQESRPVPAPLPIKVPTTPNSNNKSTSRPALSAETSKVSTIHNLPSAQPVPAPQPGLSHAQSTDELLQELPPTTRIDPQPEHPAESRNEFQPLENQTNSASLGNPDKTQEVELQKINALTSAVRHEQTPAREPETQEIIAAIKPFEFSTIKKHDPNLIPRQTPTTVTKARPTRTKKRTSFAVEHPISDDSQKSIKTGLKITKNVVPPASEKLSPKISLFGETTVDVEATFEGAHQDSRGETLPSLSSMFNGKKGSALKGILKSSNAISSAPEPSNNTTSTSMKQDAQIPIGQAGQNALQDNMIDEDKSFDLDAAIDDLGSYLGTWDAETEATKLAASKGP